MGWLDRVRRGRTGIAITLAIASVGMVGLAVEPDIVGRRAAPAPSEVADGRASEPGLVADLGPQVAARAGLLANPPPARRLRSGLTSLARMSRSELDGLIDAYWGEGAPAADKLAIFDKFWSYADAHYAAFQGIRVDWRAERRRYRDEVAAGVSRGRFAAIMNQLSLALRDSHSLALDWPVNVDTVPDRGVPLFGLSGWVADPSGACMTAQRDGSALVYSAMPDHPLGLEPGDRILGYDGVPWRVLYKRLLRWELPLWPISWGSSRSAYEHTFVMSAGLNWHLFETMDIAKHDGGIMHQPTSLMPGPLFWGFCAEQLAIPGVPKPAYFSGDFATGGIVEDSNVGYVYVWSFDGAAREDFAAVVHQLTQVDQVDGLIIDLRFNDGGIMSAPFDALGELAAHPTPTIAMDGRASEHRHFAMKEVVPPSEFLLDYAYDDEAGTKERVPGSFAGPVALLVGPGAVSAGDIAALVTTYLPRSRTFGRSTAMAVGLPTQPALGTELDLGPDWFARVAETNAFHVRSPGNYLIHDEFPVDQRVWLRPRDVAAGKDTVVEAALRWLGHNGAD